uniref:lysozyme n=1 Tax=Macrostomum lignano TaxID=282301 RepID=A0A1I8J8Q5_9PLAT
ITALIVLLCIAASHQQLPSLPEEFFRCICLIESDCNNNIGCAPDPTPCPAVPTRLRTPSGSTRWLECTTGRNNQACSRETMLYYFARYGRYCTNNRPPTLQDYARIHNGGPLGCRHHYTAGYWDKVRTCLEPR